MRKVLQHRVPAWIVPLPYAVWINRKYVKPPRDAAVRRRVDECGAELEGAALEADDPAENLFRLEIARVERLEDKLTKSGDLLNILVPLVTALVGATYARGLGLAGLLASLAAVQLVLAYMGALFGASTYAFHTPTSQDILRELQEAKPHRARMRVARYLALVDGNVPRGIAVNNLISAVRRTVALTVLLATLATGLLAFDLSAGGTPARSQSPSRDAPASGPAGHPQTPPAASPPASGVAGSATPSGRANRP